jgi:hypothetical protein
VRQGLKQIVARRRRSSSEPEDAFDEADLLGDVAPLPAVELVPVLCGNPNVPQARQIRVLTAATNSGMPGPVGSRSNNCRVGKRVGLENVRRRQFLSSFGGGSAIVPRARSNSDCAAVIDRVWSGNWNFVDQCGRPLR